MRTEDDVRIFFDHLRRRGFSIGVEQYLSASALIRRLNVVSADSLDSNTVEGLIGPIVCTTPEQQEQFRQHFRSWVALQGGQDKGKPDKKKGNLRWRTAVRRGVFTLLTVVLFFTGIYAVSNFVGTGGSNTPTSVEENRRAQETFVRSQGTDEARIEAGKNKPNASSTTRPAPEEKAPEQKPVSTKASGTPEHSGTQAEIKLEGNKRKPPTSPSYWQRLGDMADRINFASVGLLCLLGFGLVYAYLRRRIFVLGHGRGSDSIPQLQDVLVAVPETSIHDETVRRTLAGLYRYEATPSKRINPRATVAESLRKGDWLMPIFGTVPRLAEYITLVDRRSANDHQANYFDSILKLLRSQNVPHIDFSFHQSPDYCWHSTDDRRAITPRELHDQHPNAKVMFFSSAAALVDPVTGRPDSHVDEFLNWERIALLTPDPPKEWTLAEWEMRKAGIAVIPGDRSGFEQLPLAMQEEDVPLPRSLASGFEFPETLLFEPEIWTSNVPVSEEELQNLLFELRGYLGPQGYDWLCACALYPVLVWPLTLRLGHVLGIFALPPLQAERSLIDLVRLPWFRMGYFPRWLRAHLINSISDDLQPKLRNEIFQVLNAIVSDDADGTKLNVGFDRSASSGEIAELVSELENVPAEHQLNDRALLRFLEGTIPSKEELLAPPKFAAAILEQLDPEVRRRAEWQRFRRTLRYCFAGLLLLVALPFTHSDFRTWTGNTVFEPLRQHVLVKLWPPPIDRDAGPQSNPDSEDAKKEESELATNIEPRKPDLKPEASERGEASVGSAFAQVTTEWKRPGGNYSAQRFSRLNQITRANVKDLQVAWSFSTGVLRGHEGQPLVIGETMYLVTPFPNLVFALNLNNEGGILWRYEPKQDPSVIPVMCCDTVNRGLAYSDGILYLYQANTELVALDAKTGKELWKAVNGDPRAGETATNAPIFTNGKVIVGLSGGEFGVRGHLTAYNAKTGKRLWRAYSTGPDTDILFDPAKTTSLGRPVGKDSSLKTWQGDQWKIGGGTAWGWFSYDPELNLIYYGSGNPSTWNPSQRRGDNKWSASIFARDADTGVAKWVYQMTPFDEWSYDGTNEMILADIDFRGEKRKVLVHFDKNGLAYTLDRVTGELLVAEKFDPAVNWTTGVEFDKSKPNYGRPYVVERYSTAQNGADVNTKGICPASIGAKNQGPAAFSPRTGLFYVPTNHVCMDLEPFNVSYTAGQPYVGATLAMYPAPNSHGGRGNFIAWNAENGKIVWSKPESHMAYSGALTTAGDIVVYGTLDGYLKAVDVQTGKELFRYRAPSGIVGNPITYQFKGKQYLAVLSGVGGWAGIGLAAGLTFPTDGLGAVGLTSDLHQNTALGGQLIVLALP